MAMTKKRNLFKELKQGILDLIGYKAGKTSLRTTKIKKHKGSHKRNKVKSINNGQQ